MGSASANAVFDGLCFRLWLSRLMTGFTVSSIFCESVCVPASVCTRDFVCVWRYIYIYIYIYSCVCVSNISIYMHIYIYMHNRNK